MAVDYDLVVIGNSAAGIHAATAAAHLKARVALIEQNISTLFPVNDRVLVEVGRTLQQVQRAQYLGIASPDSAVSLPDLWQQATRWHAAVTSAIEAPKSAAVLSSLGIEVIAGCGEFYRKPSLGFTVNGRQLRSRAYLIATGSTAQIPEIQGLQTIDYLLPETLLQSLTNLKHFKHLVIIGAAATGVELAQTLSRFGVEVTLVMQEAHILPHADPEAARFVQAQLEAEGIRVLTGVTVTQVRQIQNKKWVQAGNQAIETDEILLATAQQITTTALNLEAANVRQTAQGITVNERLQTTNPRIYACVPINGHFSPHLALHQAEVAVQNVLFGARSTVSYHNIPDVLTQPALAQTGLTEPDAIARYGKDVLILRQSFSRLPQAQIEGEIGLCKLIVRRDGEILGAHIVGPQASELIGTIALAIQQHLKIPLLANLPFPSPTFSEIIRQTATEWQWLRLAHNTRRQNFLEWFFTLRRSWG